MFERNFTLVGKRGIRCNNKCEVWEACSRLHSGLSDLGVEIFDPVWIGQNGETFTQVCMFGESGYRFNKRDAKRPDLKQPDGWTPRVCLGREERSVRDASSKEIIKQ